MSWMRGVSAQNNGGGRALPPDSEHGDAGAVVILAAFRSR